MGWNRAKQIGVKIIGGRALYTFHMDYINAFWDSWINNGTGTRPLKAAIQQAETDAPAAAGGMVLYGAENLVINY
jgi:hypothetical protein